MGKQKAPAAVSVAGNSPPQPALLVKVGATVRVAPACAVCVPLTYAVWVPATAVWVPLKPPRLASLPGTRYVNQA